MACIINASTASGLIQSADTSGQIQLQWNGQAAPAFSAYANATQSITTATQTKVAINTELFDTNSNFDTTNNRFTPTVEGYYQVNGVARLAGSAATQMVVSIYKNGALYVRGTDIVFSASGLATMNCTVNEVIYMNGTTDYLELYGAAAATTPSLNFASIEITSRFSACLVRGA
jgi:Tol biopolymer transport system component